jgi:cytochrome P450
MSDAAAAPFAIDLFSAEVIADPQPVYRMLRDEHPVYYSADYDTFFLSRFEDVWEALRIGDNALLATETNLPTPEYLRSRRNAGAPPFAPINPMAPGPRLASPWYEEMRQAHIAPLRPKAAEALRRQIQALARERLDALLPRRKFNLTLDYAGIVGVTVICSLFGLPAARAGELMDKVNEIARYSPDKKSIDLSTFFTALTDDIAPAIRARRAGGADGANRLIDGLINYRTQPDGRALDDAEIADQLVCAMVGGIESMPKVTAQGILELHRRPEQLAAVRADLAANVPVAVQEMIRYCAPAQYTFRTAHRDVEVAGVRVKAGQRIACMLNSASRDEREFADPDAFVWNRPIPRVLSFGLGQHHCIGKHLAQLEVAILVHEFLSRVSAFDFALDEAKQNAGYIQRGWIELPVVILD